MAQEKFIAKTDSLTERVKWRSDQANKISNFIQSQLYLKQIKDNLWSNTIKLNEKFSEKQEIDMLNLDIVLLLDSLGILEEYLIREFSNNPTHAKYFFGYVICELDKALQESFDYYEDNFCLEPLDEKLEEDIFFGLHKGKEIKKAGLTEEQASQISHSIAAASMWAGMFRYIVETYEKLNRFYTDDFNLSFKSFPIEVGSKLFDSRDKSMTNEVVDLRKSTKAPTNASRIKALKEYCPELWIKLAKSQSKDVQQNVIHAITGVNKEDSYKLSFGHRQSELDKVVVNDFENLISK